MSKKRYFAQNDICNATGHRAKHFDDLAEAVEWLKGSGFNGTVKDRRNESRVVEAIVANRKPFKGRWDEWSGDIAIILTEWAMDEYDFIPQEFIWQLVETGRYGVEFSYVWRLFREQWHPEDAAWAIFNFRLNPGSYFSEIENAEYAY